MNVWSNITDTVTAPFVAQLSLVDYAKIVGAVLILTILWLFVINHIMMAAAEI